MMKLWKFLFIENLSGNSIKPTPGSSYERQIAVPAITQPFTFVYVCVAVGIQRHSILSAKIGEMSCQSCFGKAFLNADIPQQKVSSTFGTLIRIFIRLSFRYLVFVTVSIFVFVFPRNIFFAASKPDPPFMKTRVKRVCDRPSVILPG